MKKNIDFHLLNDFILTIFCILISSHLPFDFIYMLLFCLTLSILLLSYLSINKGLLYTIGFINTLLSFIFPLGTFFLPMLVYAYKHQKNNVLLIAQVLIGINGLSIYGFDTSTFFIILGCLLSLVLLWQTTSYTALSHQLTNISDSNKETLLKLQSHNKKMIESQNGEIYNATLKERNRIAREIHDNVGHILSRSLLMIGALKACNNDSNMDIPLHTLEDSLQQAMCSIRQSVHDLHDDSINLKEALEYLARDFTMCPLQLYYDMSLEIPKEIKYCILTIVKEGLSNIMRHSNAPTKVTLTVRQHPGLYQLILEDNGKAPILPSITTQGIGLENMKDRISQLHGIFKTDTTHGFKIYITIPIHN